MRVPFVIPCAAIAMCVASVSSSAQFVQSGAPGHEPQMAAEYKQAAAWEAWAATQRNYRAFQNYHKAMSAYYTCLAEQLGPHGPAQCRVPVQPTDDEARASGIADATSSSPAPEAGALLGGAGASGVPGSSSGIARDENGLVGGSMALTGIAIVNDVAKSHPDMDPNTVFKAGLTTGAVGGVADILGWRSRKKAKEQEMKAQEEQQMAAQREEAARQQAVRDSVAQVEAQRLAVERAEQEATAAAQAHAAAERRATGRALLDSARQSLLAADSVLRAGDVVRANTLFATARKFRSSVQPDDSLTADLRTFDTTLVGDSAAIAIGNAVLARATPPMSRSIDITHAGASAAAEREQRAAERAAEAARAQTIADSVARVREVELDSAAARTKRELATSVYTAPPTPGLEEIGGRVLSVRTFESTNPPAPLGTRRYQRAFETAATRYLHTEVSVGFTGEASTPSIELTCWTRLNDSVLVQQPVRVSHPGDASVFLFTVGIGWGIPSRLEPGRYVTGCDRNGARVLADSFVVTGSTAHSAFVAAEANARANGWAAAAAAYDTAVRLDSGIAPYHYGYGVALERLGRDSAAADHYALAVRLAPNELPYHLEYAAVLHRLGRRVDAVREYRESVRLDPANAKRHMVLADALLEMGDRSAALAEYHLAASTDPVEPYYQHQISVLSRP